MEKCIIMKVHDATPKEISKIFPKILPIFFPWCMKRIHVKNNELKLQNYYYYYYYEKL